MNLFLLCLPKRQCRQCHNSKKMKIISLTYQDRSRRWRLEPVSFRKLTLLIGASGVGKTQILKSVLNLKKISNGDSINGLKWKIRFSTFDNDNIYLWEGEFENFPVNKEGTIPKILYEKLYVNNSAIIVRDQTQIIFNGEKTVRLPYEKSVIYLLKEEDSVSDIGRNFQKILLHNNSEERQPLFSSGHTHTEPDNYRTIEDIRESNESIRMKLYLASSKAADVFERIKTRFTDVFPFVGNLKAELINEPSFMRGVPLIQIKEIGSDEWIGETHISSGMHRILLHICELYLCADGSVILADEFENSLGINCIDEITNVLLTHNRDLQFIITSHHPYIINNINRSNWKLVTRKAGVVTARDAADFNLSRSRHEAFTQLINLDEYAEGIEV